MTTIFFATNRKPHVAPADQLLAWKRGEVDANAVELEEDFQGQPAELRFGSVTFDGDDLYKQDIDDVAKG